MGAETEHIVARLRVIVRSLSVIARRNDPERRRELIALRRDLIGELGVLSIAVRGDAQIAANGSKEVMNSQLSQARASVAYHQATWSVVLIDNDPESYRASAEATSATLNALFDAVDQALKRRSTN